MRHRFTSLRPPQLLANMAFCGAVKTLEANHPQTATGPCFSERVTSTPLLASKVIKKAIDPLPACHNDFRGASGRSNPGRIHYASRSFATNSRLRVGSSRGERETRLPSQCPCHCQNQTKGRAPPQPLSPPNQKGPMRFEVAGGNYR